MRHAFLWIFLAAAGSGAALAVACSSSSSDTGTTPKADSGTSGTSGASGTSGSAGASGTSGDVPDKDTCLAAANENTCQCSCGITGQTENTMLHCKQPAAQTGECKKVCCTGPIIEQEAGSSSGVMDSGAMDSGGD
jgi:hypothetical protein